MPATTQNQTATGEVYHNYPSEVDINKAVHICTALLAVLKRVSDDDDLAQTISGGKWKLVRVIDGEQFDDFGHAESWENHVEALCGLIDCFC